MADSSLIPKHLDLRNKYNPNTPPEVHKDWADKWIGRKDDAPFIAQPSHSPWSKPRNPFPAGQEDLEKFRGVLERMNQREKEEKANLEKDIKELDKRKRREQKDIDELVEQRNKVAEQIAALQVEVDELQKQIKRLRQTQAVLVDNDMDLGSREA